MKIGDRLDFSYFWISAQPAPPECLTKGGANPNKPCVFPFTWNGAIYSGCPVDPDDENERWCSTKVDANGLHLQGQDQWGHCSASCPISAPPPKRPSPPQRPVAPQGQVMSTILKNFLDYIYYNFF